MSTLTNAHALVIGIADYQHVPRLPQVRDAQAIAEALIDPAVCDYLAANVQVLGDAQATLSAIRAALAALQQHCDADSTVLIFFSGHGGQITAEPHADTFLLPIEADASSAETLAQTALSGTEFAQALRAIPARKMVVVLDCCHAAGVGLPKDVVLGPLQLGLPEGYYDLLKAGRGRVILASSRSNEFSYVLPGAAYGLFTQHLLVGLRGGAPSPGGVVRIFDLFHYVQPRVTADCPQQHPIFRAEVEENFAIARGRGEHEVAPAAIPPDDGFAYDLFISYRQKDPTKTWVRKTLLPRLEAAGLRVCIDYRDFRLGAPLVLEMSRAVETSRYTLCILTPLYLESNFTELENVLAEHLGTERSERRLLAVMREECTPRLGIRMRLWLDMTDDDEFEIASERLIYELRQSPKK